MMQGRGPLACRLLGCIALATLSGYGWAAEPSSPPASAQAALEVLLKSSVGQPAPAVGAAGGVGAVGVAGVPAVGRAGEPAVQGRTTVTVARGQALDSLLRQHLPQSPLKVEVLRELVRQLNPQAVSAAPGYRLTAGAKLQLPSTEDQVQHAFGKALAPRDQPAAEGGSGAAGGAAAAARRGWVRYP